MIAAALFGAVMSSSGFALTQGPPAAPSDVKVSTDSVTDPVPEPWWVHVHPGDNIQQLVNNHHGATTFYLRAGVHRLQSVKPKTDNRFIGEVGAVMDGENVTAHAFDTSAGTPARVVIRNITIRNYASPSPWGAIQGDNGSAWVIEDTVVHDNAYIGIRVGADWQVRRNKVYQNGKIGISGFKAHRALIESNQVFGNNHLQAPEQPITAEAAGMKFLRSTDMVIRGNHVYGNKAKGIWVDGNFRTTIIEGNTVTDNAHEGIWLEISDGGIIRHNTVLRNGPPSGASWLTRAGIQVSNSPDVQVYGNFLQDNANGITAMQVVRHDGIALELRNLVVRENTVIMNVGYTGVGQNINDQRVYLEWNNRFERNTYQLGTRTTYFSWGDKYLSETQWRAVAQDVDGTFNR